MNIFYKKYFRDQELDVFGSSAVVASILSFNWMFVEKFFNFSISSIVFIIPAIGIVFFLYFYKKRYKEVISKYEDHSKSRQIKIKTIGLIYMAISFSAYFFYVLG